MDTDSIFRKHLIDECLNKIKLHRDQWRTGQWNTENKKDGTNRISSLCDIGGEDYSYYSFIMKQARESIYEALIEIVQDLVKGSGKQVSRLGLFVSDAREYYTVGPSQNPVFECKQNYGLFRRINGIGLEQEGDWTVYIFREPDLKDILPTNIEQRLLAEPNISRITYVTFAEKGTPANVLNWEDRENEELRGYKTYSLEEFMDDVFGQSEWPKLSKYLDELKDMALDYCGLSIVKAIRPNSLKLFRQSINDASKAYAIGSTLTNRQREALNKRFLDEGACEALTGAEDFAKSFMTAEWLYDSLKDACRERSSERTVDIDLTPITTSYFKAIEQYLYAFVSIHTHERDGANRTIFIGYNRGKELKPSSHAKLLGAPSQAIQITQGNVVVDDYLMSPGFKEILNLGYLTHFFGNYDDKRGKLYPNNTDLLITGMESLGIYDAIVNTLRDITIRRNSFVHKDNLYDWNEVETVRDMVRLAFYLLLGAYKMSPADESFLGITHGVKHNDFYNICEYINNCALSGGSIESSLTLPVTIPVFYCGDSTIPLTARRDSGISEYDTYGNPLFTGVHFGTLRTNPRDSEPLGHRSEIVFGESNMPKRISEGTYEIYAPSLKKNHLTGPQKVIFEDGKYYGA
ncbi:MULTISPECIES: hypothetical protein [unclassified Adlercreutzia]|uniref:hypothetical protein n=1 Tax=unclassified Adlercreutzia TaxID=2636013 RepID=UPI0013EC6D2C|nr:MULTISPECIES: hypothetical protein [unclassified Adlercreutzia]